MFPILYLLKRADAEQVKLGTTPDMKKRLRVLTVNLDHEKSFYIVSARAEAIEQELRKEFQTYRIPGQKDRGKNEWYYSAMLEPCRAYIEKNLKKWDATLYPLR